MTAHSRKVSGFTLVEVMLVLVIVGVLATVLMTTVGGQTDKSKIMLTQTGLKRIASKLDEYNVAIGHYPTEAEGGLKALVTLPSFENDKLKDKWAGPYIDSLQINDAWDNAFNYEPAEAGGSGKKYKLWSNGPDGQSSTDDDIKNWDENES